MAYRIKRLPYKKRSWKVQIETFQGQRKIWDLPAEDYTRLGFSACQSIDEAKQLKDRLNAQEELKRRATKRAQIQDRLKEERLAQFAYLPEAHVLEFESQVLFARGENPKLKSHWHMAKTILCELKIEPEFWVENANRFYDWFSKRSLSLSYVQKVRRVLNDWGRFYSRKYRTPFEPIPAPRSYEKERIADKYFDKHENGLASAPLSPSMLESVKESLRPEHYRWLYITIWFGLRPEEADAIGRGKHYEVIEQDGYQILKVFQTKLVRVPRNERWKYIPAVRPEQVLALKFMREPIKRPSRKILKDRFGERMGVYGGRKNFTDMMLDNGFTLEDVSSWLGHRTVERTWRNYKNRNKVRLPKAA